MLIFILSAQLLLNRSSNAEDDSFFLWLFAINYFDITCFLKGFSLYILERRLISTIKYAIDPQSKIIFIELQLGGFRHNQPQICINNNALVYKGRCFFRVITELARKIVDKGKKGEKIVTWYSSVGLTLKLLPQRKEMLLILYLS